MRVPRGALLFLMKAQFLGEMPPFGGGTQWLPRGAEYDVTSSRLVTPAAWNPDRDRGAARGAEWMMWLSLLLCPCREAG